MFVKVVVLFVYLKCIVAHPQLNSMENDQQLNFREHDTKFNYLLEKMSRSTTIGSKIFYLEFAKLNFFKAVQQCAAHDLQLARIESAAEQTAVENLITDYAMDNEHYWIAGNDLGYFRSWFWMTTGKPVVYKNWSDGEPNNYNGLGEHCIHLNYGRSLKWNDVMCTNEYYYICEKIEGNCQ